ncbi:3675_t:CDS:2, partial [Racocetra persica]
MNKEKIDNMLMAYSDEVIENGMMINSDSLKKDLKEDVSSIKNVEKIIFE